MTEKTNDLDELNVNRGVFKLYESFASDREYDASSCLSYSKIKELHDNPEVLVEERDRTEKEWFTFGTMVDLMLTSPDDVDKKIFVNDKVPTEQFKNTADYMVSNNYGLAEIEGLENLTDGWETAVESYYLGGNSAVNWKPDTKRLKLIENCKDYITLLTVHKNQLIVPTEQFVEAQKVAEVFRSHPWTKDYFISEEEQQENHVEIFYQYKIKYIYEGLQCKSKLDIVFIDHDLRIICPIDIKTGNDSPRSFINHALYKYKYGYQGALYKEGLIKFISKIAEFSEYEVDDFRFIYISRQKPTFPVTLVMNERCHDEFVTLGIYNLIYDIPPLSNLMAEAKFYIDIINKGETPTIPYDILRANGILEADSIEDLTFVS